MNKRDYEIYKAYTQQKQALWTKYIDEYNKALKNLENNYGKDMDTIEEVEYIVKNKKPLIQLVVEGVIYALMLPLSSVPFIMAKRGILSHLGTIIPIMYIIFGFFISFVLFLNEIKPGIQYYIKYNKMMKD